MKKILLLIIYLSGGILFLHSCAKDQGIIEKRSTCTPKGKVVINVGAGGNFFSPASTDVKVGDTIVWRWQSGYHSATSTSVPAGAASFVKDPLQATTDSLVYVLQISGTYNYQCDYHSGMTGTINACK